MNRIRHILQDPPPAMAFEISEAGIAAARIGSRAEIEFRPLKSGTLAISPFKENVVDSDELTMTVRALAGAQVGRKRRDATLILPDYSTRIAVLDFDSFPSDTQQQLSLIRFRLKRSVPFDVETAVISYWAQPAAGKRIDVVVVMSPLEIVARYEAPFRAAGLSPGLVTTSLLAALELAPETGVSVIAKLSGRVLSVLVREQAAIKLVRCLEMPGAGLEDIASVLIPTFVYIEDNLAKRADRLLLCGFGRSTEEARQGFEQELGVEVEALASPLGMPGEGNAGLFGYLRSIARDN